MTKEPSKILRPGFASEEEPDPTTAKPKLPKTLALAHYADLTTEEATELWKSETLCTGCLLSSMCVVATQCPEPLVVVSRCLAYIPLPG